MAFSGVTYQQLEELFFDLQIDASPSGYHGYLCGCLCCGSLGEDDLLELSVDWMVLDDDRVARAYEPLREICQSVRTRLEHPEFLFQPLLPDDELPLAERLDAVGEWCSNYISGVGERMAGAFEVSAEGREALEDIAAISRVSPQFDNEGDPEEDYVELVEYIRIAVQTVFADLNNGESPDQPPTIH